MKDITKGYVIVDTKDNNRILASTFKLYKRDCISDFVSGSGENWKYWRNKYKFKCVNANQIIEINH